ncbi:hypothetical protein [Saccharopolyspora gloriosae]|uniref:hypothetical protein n=1 Tax=Saccharopolyspora gloriosae TaxID=455344 RepID=UPI001FB57BC3|nr:hypothetical protein [Saccharopolyspora gloriosae]
MSETLLAGERAPRINRRQARGGRARTGSGPHGLALTQRRVIDHGRRTTTACRRVR